MSCAMTSANPLHLKTKGMTMSLTGGDRRAHWELVYKTKRAADLLVSA
jgi:hypothetical protein